MNKKILAGAAVLASLAIPFSASADDNVLTLMENASESDSILNAMRDVVAEFNETNEYGVTIEMENLANADYKTKLSTVMAADSEPDIFFTWELGYLGNFVNGGKVIDLQEYLDADPEWRDSFNAGILEPLTYDGDVYGIPTTTTCAMMYYNKTIFEEQGLEVPTTIEELEAVCDKLLEAGITPFALGGTPEDAWLVSQIIQELANGIAGYDLYASLVDGTGAWNDPAFVEAAQLLQKWIDAGYFEEGFTGVGNNEARSLFGMGMTAMYYNGGWCNATFSDESATDIVGEIGVFAMPASNPENAGTIMGSVNRSYAISKNCKNVDAAVAFLKFITAKEFQETLVYDYASNPSTQIEVDNSKLNDLAVATIDLIGAQEHLTAWFDRVNTDMGNEFNNSANAIANGDDPQEIYDTLQAFYENQN